MEFVIVLLVEFISYVLLEVIFKVIFVYPGALVRWLFIAKITSYSEGLRNMKTNIIISCVIYLIFLLIIIYV